jgi:DNA-binding response OmpR family regulator
VRLLVVEDDPKLGDLLRRGLSKHGNVADLASTGEEALWMAKAHTSGTRPGPAT